MATPTFTKTGTKATATVTLDKKVFGEKVESHNLLHQAYVTYLANGRENLAVTKTRGQVRGGGKKPWKQKGTGRARFGSSRVPIWRGGGITFGPTGNENYSKKLNVKAKRKAIRQALSLASKSNQVIVVEDFATLGGKTKDMAKFLSKVGASGRTLVVVDQRDPSKELAVQNIPKTAVVSASYLNVYDVMNADSIVVSKKALELISDWLGGDK